MALQNIGDVQAEMMKRGNTPESPIKDGTGLGLESILEMVVTWLGCNREPMVFLREEIDPHGPDSLTHIHIYETAVGIAVEWFSPYLLETSHTQ